nr:hypothetical protein [Ramlibacter albus]
MSKREANPSVEVFALRERFEQDAKDHDWLGALKATGESSSVLSADNFRKSDAERELMRTSGLNVFVLQKSWASQSYWAQAAQLVHWWPRIISQAAAVQRSAYRVPWRTSGKFEQIRL